MVDNNSLLLGGVVAEASGPPFEGLEAEGERVLAWGKSRAVEDHCLVSSEHVAGLEVLHFVKAVS